MNGEDQLFCVPGEVSSKREIACNLVRVSECIYPAKMAPKSDMIHSGELNPRIPTP